MNSNIWYHVPRELKILWGTFHTHGSPVLLSGSSFRIGFWKETVRLVSYRREVGFDLKTCTQSKPYFLLKMLFLLQTLCNRENGTLLSQRPDVRGVPFRYRRTRDDMGDRVVYSTGK